MEFDNQEQNVHEQLTISDEVHFHLSGHVNEQTMRYWSDSNPQELHSIPLHSQRVTIWCTVSSVRVYGLYFFKDDNGNSVSMNSDQYV